MLYIHMQHADDWTRELAESLQSSAVRHTCRVVAFRVDNTPQRIVHGMAV